MDLVISIVVIVFGVLQLILFFKLWGMANYVKEIKNFLVKDSLEWANDVTEAEKIEVMSLINKLKSEQVIVKVISDKKIYVWDVNYWENKPNKSYYKLIYKN